MILFAFASAETLVACFLLFRVTFLRMVNSFITLLEYLVDLIYN